MMVPADIEPKRIRDLRLSLANIVPRFPNDRKTLKLLEDKSLGGILIDYLNWSKRYITPRKRELRVAPEVFSDRRFNLYKKEIAEIFGKAERGEDLTPYLSTQPKTRGYSPNAGVAGPEGDRWSGKDFVLNVMGLHHLHLDAMLGKSLRSDDMLFVEATKTTFTLVGIFNHEVFEPPPSRSSEKERLWQRFETRATSGASPGAVIAMAPIATSGHSLETNYRAMAYARRISAMDPRIDQREFVEQIYKDANIKVPRKPKLKWTPWFQDLGIYDVSTGGFFSVCSGWN